jgi:hypothetical protein
MRHQVFAIAVVASLLGCESKKTTNNEPKPGSAARPTAQLTDLTSVSTLAPVRSAFNAKKGEARFLTLLAPT